MYSPRQILRDANAQIFAHPLHCSPIDVEGGVGPLLAPSEDHHQLLGIADIQLEGSSFDATMSGSPPPPSKPSHRC